MSFGTSKKSVALEKAIKDAYDAGVDTNDVVAEAALEASVEENTEEPDTFEYVSDDEAYVEGRWICDGHRGCIDNYHNNYGSLTNNEYVLLKYGVVAPDRHDLYGLHNTNPEWHGKYFDNNANFANKNASSFCYTLTNAEKNLFKSASADD